MMNAHHNLTKSAVVVLGLALAGGGTAHAQTTGGPGRSSGSGSGTGAGGVMGGVQRNQSGSMSGVGPGSTGSGTILRGRPIAPLPGARARENLVPFRPGRRRHVSERSLPDSLHDDGAARAQADGKAADKVTEELLRNARLISRRASGAWPCNESPTAPSPAASSTWPITSSRKPRPPRPRSPFR